MTVEQLIKILEEFKDCSFKCYYTGCLSTDVYITIKSEHGYLQQNEVKVSNYLERLKQVSSKDGTVFIKEYPIVKLNKLIRILKDGEFIKFLT